MGKFFILIFYYFLLYFIDILLVVAYDHLLCSATLLVSTTLEVQCLVVF